MTATRHRAVEAKREAESLAERIEAEFPGWQVKAEQSSRGEWYLDGEDSDGTMGFFVPVSQIRGRRHLGRALRGLGTAPGGAV